MKQGKTEKAVFAKLSTEKVELEEQKLELSLMMEAGSVYTDFVNSWKETFKNVMSARQEARRVGQDVDRTEALLTKSRSIVDELIKKHNDLFGTGDLPQRIKDMDKVLTRVKGELKDFKDWSNKARKE